MRIGTGYDIHRLTEGRAMMIGGVHIPYPRGPEGHSDGDCLLHAVCDAILGALGEGDIGERFPDTDRRYMGISSRELLADVAALMDEKGFRIGNLDCVVMAEDPKISPFREEMVRLIEETLKADPGSVNVKGKTAERTGPVGSGEAIAAYSVVLLEER